MAHDPPPNQDNRFESTVIAADAGHGLLLVRWAGEVLALPARRSALLGQRLAWQIAAADVVVELSQAAADPHSVVMTLDEIMPCGERCTLSLRAAHGAERLRAEVSATWCESQALQCGASLAVSLPRERIVLD